jgi:SAM-dependent methyltransferase
VVAGTLPILVDDPARSLADASLEASRLRAQFEAAVEALAAAVHVQPGRAAILRRMQDAARANAALIARIEALLPGTLTSSPGADANARPGRGREGRAQALEYLQRDWCGRPEGEDEIRRIRDAVSAQWTRLGAERRLAVVLGAGTGRLAWELRTQFPRVVAVDTSLVMAGLHHLLQESDIEFHVVRTRNVYSRDELVQKRVASLSAAGRQEGHVGELTYAVADALAVPLASGSVTAVLSAYFSDLVPWPPLLTEVRRLLAPGGVFVHFGPLDYHHASLQHHLAADEVRELVAAFGLGLCPGSESWIRAPHLAASGMKRREYDNWTFAARKEAEA